MLAAADIHMAEKKLATALQYEERAAGDARRVLFACKLTDAHARKVRRLIEQGAAVSPRTQNILAYLERAS